MKPTFKSILSAMLSASLVGAAQYSQAGGTSLKGTGLIAGVGALVGLANYLAQSPVAKTPDAPPAAAVAAQPPFTTAS